MSFLISPVRVGGGMTKLPVYMYVDSPIMSSSSALMYSWCRLLTNLLLPRQPTTVVVPDSTISAQEMSWVLPMGPWPSSAPMRWTWLSTNPG